MKPNDRFSFVKNNRVSQDTSSMVQCYLPIIGQEALSLYLYAVTFWDGGQKRTSLCSHAQSSQFWDGYPFKGF